MNQKELRGAMDMGMLRLMSTMGSYRFTILQSRPGPKMTNIVQVGEGGSYTAIVLINQFLQ